MSRLPTAPAPLVTLSSAAFSRQHSINTVADQVSELGGVAGNRLSPSDWSSVNERGPLACPFATNRLHRTSLPNLKPARNVPSRMW